ncbi:alpha-hydroxy-acid oxidizing protein [Caenimonas sedimenti]|uniref:Alpha-hydroxy-acid oxidizing protein n=1 Tax=Caenimonas sedimenti TaxID=2596921 RepID=A0A562ZWA6_9BURK|nr:alpha-hydroxy acid oxidase [Caenimonas sedimenti]TWO72666.1 alpha-hydroxy-acid oxidizing protein [Caenimonas sedimenti]
MSLVPTLTELPPARSAAAYATHAQARLDANAWNYVEASAGDGRTRQANRDAWDAMTLWPRVLQPLGGLDLTVELLGRTWPTPLLVAPMALQKLVHADGELATVLAAAAQGVGMVLSTQTSMPMQQVSQAVRDDVTRGPLWFQLYMQGGRAATLRLVRQAEAAGYEAIVLTVDASFRAPHAAFRLPAGVAAVHLPPPAHHDAGGLLAAAPTWDDVAWLLSETTLPLLLKGVLHPEDAREAVRSGVQGLIVSNHGGRNLDTAIASATALRAVADAVGGTLPLLVDGGLQRGTDVLKALALGASAVLIGRPVLHGLGTAGAAGAAHVLRLLRDELAIAMAQCGIRRPAAASRGLLAPESP